MANDNGPDRVVPIGAKGPAVIYPSDDGHRTLVSGTDCVLTYIKLQRAAHRPIRFGNAIYDLSNAKAADKHALVKSMTDCLLSHVDIQLQ